jgi:hypothetical protein
MCAAISTVVSPFAVKDNTISSMPGQSALALLDDLRLERADGGGTSISTGRPRYVWSAD